MSSLPTRPTILLAGRSTAHIAMLESGLRAAGYLNVSVEHHLQNLPSCIVASQPDLILIDLENPTRDVLEQIFQLARSVRRAIAVFVEQADAATIDAAIDAGISAFIVDGLKQERVPTIVHTTLSRFHSFDRLRQQLDRAKLALQERKLIDRAKGILMKERGIEEEAAYGLLRRTAMNDSLKLADVAQSVITAAHLFK